MKLEVSDKVFTNSSGKEYKIIAYSHSTPKKKFWVVKFSQTGYTCKATSAEIGRGAIKDWFAPSVCGIGFLGEKIEGLSAPTQTREYRVWHNMLNRCYNPKFGEWKRYGALGVTVCERWHNFNNFYNDIRNLNGYNKELFESNSLHLDKDMLQYQLPYEEKVYSPTTCVFLSPKENGELIDREHKAIYSIAPWGEKTEWESVMSFIAAHPRFLFQGVYCCLSKHRPHYRKWKFEYCNDYRKPVGINRVSRVAASETLVSEVQST